MIKFKVFYCMATFFMIAALPVAVMAESLPPASSVTVQPALPATAIKGEGEADKLDKLKAGAIGSDNPAVVVEDIPRFDITRFQVEGNTILPAADIDALLAPFTGKKKDFGDVQQAIETLEDSYKSTGFHAVRVLLPEQELKDGAVTLKVVEARIGKVIIDGNTHYDNANIRNALHRLKEGEFPHIDKISSQIRVANESPTRKIQMLMEEGDADDKVNVMVKVADERPWKIGTYLEDTGTKATGTLRLGVLAQHTNLFNKDHLLTLQYVTSPDHTKEVNIYSFGYRIPIYSLGDSLDLYAGYSDVDSGTVSTGVLNLSVSGKGSFGGFRYNKNLVRLGIYEHKIIAGFDYRTFESSVLFSGMQLGNNTESHTALLGYSGSFSGSAGEAGFSLSLSQNIPGDGDGSRTAFERVRTGAAEDFTIFKGGVNAVAVFPADWQARFTANGQYTQAALIPGEQFGIGGQGSVRGFGEREFSDDNGLAGSAELYTPNIMSFAESLKTQFRALTFYDAGYLGRNKGLAGEKNDRTIASTGLGVRLSVGKYLTAGTDYAFITEPAKVPEAKSRYSGRWHFKVQVVF